MATSSLPTSQELRRSGAAALLTGVLLFAVVVLSRRSAGALTGFESATPAVLIAGGLMLIGTISGTLLRRRDDLEFDLVLIATTLLATPGLLVGLCLLPSDSSGIAVLLAEFAFLVTISLADRGHSADCDSIAPQNTQAVGVPPLGGLEVSEDRLKPEFQQVACDSNETDIAPDISHADIEHPSNVTQWLRRLLQDDVEIIEGTIRVHFASGCKQVAVHLPFSPPMTGLPDFEAEPLDDADLNVQVTATHSYGVRFEVTRRHGLEEPFAAEIGYQASAAIESERAAA